MARGSETVQVIPRVVVDRLRPAPEGAGPASYDLAGCHVIPRASDEEGRGTLGIEGYDIYYFGTLPAPERTDRIGVRDEVHEIEGKPRDFIVKGRRKGLIITTKGVS